MCPQPVLAPLVKRLLEPVDHVPHPNWQSGRAARWASCYVTCPREGEWGEGIAVLGETLLRLFVLCVESKALPLAWTHGPLTLLLSPPPSLGLLARAAGSLLADTEDNVPESFATTPTLLHLSSLC